MVHAKSHGAQNIGPAEVVTLEEKGLAGALGEGIGEAVAEVQARRVATATEVAEGLAREVGLLDSDRLDQDADVAEQRITLLGDLSVELALQDDRELDEGCGGDTTQCGATHGLRVAPEARLPSRHRDDGRCVKDHFGSPSSS